MPGFLRGPVGAHVERSSLVLGLPRIMLMQSDWYVIVLPSCQQAPEVVERILSLRLVSPDNRSCKQRTCRHPLAIYPKFS